MNKRKEGFKCVGSKCKCKGNFRGIILIALGVIFFLENFVDLGLSSINWKYVWPVILIVIGVRVLLKRR